MTYDAIIIGARCAGAATALQLARGGLRVLVVDRHPPGADTMSTHALMRGAVIQLDRWGVLDRVIASGAPEVTKTRFTYGDEAIDVEIRPAFGTRSLIAPRRYVLDRLLAEAAEGAGAEFRYGTNFVDVTRDGQGRVTGAILDGPGRREHVRANLVIGADGRRSTVARRLKAAPLVTAEHTTTSVYAYFSDLPDEGYRWYYREGIGAGAIPTHDGMHCVFVSSEPDRTRSLLRDLGHRQALDRLLAETSPDLADQTRASRNVTDPVVFGGERGFLRQSAGPGWALVGDAGYFKDPLTAHGITDAFRDAELLARTVLDDQPIADYEARRNAASADLFELTDRIASLEWSLDELKGLHKSLNQVMKSEQLMLAGGADALQAAA